MDSTSATSMMTHLREMSSDIDMLKKKEFGSYQIKNIDDFRYQDPIDESVTEKQVCLVFLFFLIIDFLCKIFER